MTLQNDFEDLIDSLETNLTTMGVSDAEFNSTTGIMGLVDKILNISPSVGGIDVVTSISCQLSNNDVYYGGSIIVTGILEADKDDTSIANVDLEGYLKGATVKIYHNNTLVGTAITNGNGEYSFAYENISITGENNVHAVFEGTDDYETCTSSNVSLSVGHNILLSSSKSILSYTDNDTATITATYSGGSGETIGLYMNGRLLDYMTDNNDGTYTYSYSSHNLGDLEFYATNGALTSDSISIEDYLFYDSMTSSSGHWNIPSSYTINEYGVNGWKFGQSSSYNSVPLDYVPDYPFQIDFIVNDIGNHSYGIDLALNNEISKYITIKNNSIKLVCDNTNTINTSTIGLWSIKIYSNKISLYINNNFIVEDTITNLTFLLNFGCGSQSGRWIQIKDFKIISLIDNLTATTTVLSYADNDTTTITYTPSFDTQGATIELYDNFEDTLINEMTYDSTNGVYTYDLSSGGYGDRTLYCKLGNIVLDNIDIEDCLYYNTAEVSRTTTQGSTIYDNNLSQSLPTNCEISYDMWSDSPYNTMEHRYFLMSKSKWNSGTTQPNEALYFDYWNPSSGGKGKFGKRESSSTVGLGSEFSLSPQTTYRIKYIKDGNTLQMYFDGALKTTAQITWIDNYTDYTLSMMRWSTTGTSKLKNVKIKAL